MFGARLRRYALGLALLVLGAVALTQLQSRAHVEAGTDVGELRGELASGEVFQLGQYRGEVVVLNFWATWCAPCREEAPILSRVAASGTRVIGIAVDPVPFEKLTAKAEEIGIAYPIGKAGPDMMGALSVSVVPTTVVVAPDGTVALSRTGVVSQQELEQAVARARTGAAGPG
jgi:thiol-disulfide isomerase/thioredoxin